MLYYPAASRPPKPGPADYFTGDVMMAPLIEAPDPARLRGLTVTFQPAARTAWHTHPLGQTIIITNGYGLCQREGGEVQALSPGDVVYFEPEEKHWHGASPASIMTHIALQEALNGSHVTWLEKVSDADYFA